MTDAWDECDCDICIGAREEREREQEYERALKGANRETGARVTRPVAMTGVELNEAELNAATLAQLPFTDNR